MGNNSLEKFVGRFDRLGVRLGAPSWVWPGGYAENARKLKPVFDQVQITAYEAHSVSPVSAEETDSLAALKSDDFGYCLHLPIPTNLAVTGGSPENAIIDTISAYRKIGVTNYVLHVEEFGGWNPKLIPGRVSTIIERTGIRAEQICMENIIGTTFDKVWDSAKGLGVSVCFDVGHCVYEGGDPLKFIDAHSEKIRMAHIHGATRTADHLPLNAIPLETLSAIVSRLGDLKMDGSMVIENFSAQSMLESLEHLSKIS